MSDSSLPSQQSQPRAGTPTPVPDQTDPHTQTSSDSLSPDDTPPADEAMELPTTPRRPGRRSRWCRMMACCGRGWPSC
jgi:hypothetical protein